MISNQILQNTIDGMKGITRVDLIVTDTEGKILASTMSNAETNDALAADFAGSPADSQVLQGFQFFKVYDDHQLEYILMAKGDTDDDYKVGKMAAFHIQSLLVAYKERFDKDNFVKNLLLDNLLLVDIYNRAKKLHIEPQTRRVVFIIETKHERDNSAMEVIRSLFGSEEGNLITEVDEKSIILIQALDEKVVYDDLEDTAATIRDTLNTEAMIDVRVACGTIVDEISQVSRSFKEARMALNVGKIFYSGQRVHMYNTLGIGRLIYQLPENLCRMFIREVFTKQQPEDFDEETLSTIRMFFGNSLNVSETARQLFVHRNTLVYRLEKLSRSTGLDIRSFDDAVTFKIALMVENYLKYLEKHS